MIMVQIPTSHIFAIYKRILLLDKPPSSSGNDVRPDNANVHFSRYMQCNYTRSSEEGCISVSLRFLFTDYIRSTLRRHINHRGSFDAVDLVDIQTSMTSMLTSEEAMYLSRFFQSTLSRYEMDSSSGTHIIHLRHRTTARNVTTHGSHTPPLKPVCTPEIMRALCYARIPGLPYQKLPSAAFLQSSARQWAHILFNSRTGMYCAVHKTGQNISFGLRNPMASRDFRETLCAMLQKYIPEKDAIAHILEYVGSYNVIIKAQSNNTECQYGSFDICTYICDSI